MAKDQEACFSDSESPRDGPKPNESTLDRFTWYKRSALKARKARKKAILAKHSPLHRVMSQVMKAKRQKKVEEMRIELALASICSHSSFESVDAISRCSSLQAGSTGQQRVPKRKLPRQLPNTFRRQLNVWSQQQQSGQLLVKEFQQMKL